jgi:hypothetical protein
MILKPFKSNLLVGFFFLSSSLTSFSQLSTGKEITRELCSEKYFGRGYVKGGDSLAAIYLADEFKKRGIKPFQKSYYQSYIFDVNTFPNEVELFFNTDAMIPGKDFIIDPNSGSSELTWNYKYVTKAELFSPNFIQMLVKNIRDTKKWNSLIFETTGIKGDTLNEIKGIAEQFTQLCDVMLLTDEKFTYSVGRTQFPHALFVVSAKAFQPEAQIRTKLTAVFKKKHTAKNVIAYLPAKKKTKETLVFTAHYDHLGGLGSKVYFPGGNDNASGTAMLFSLAEHFQKNPSNYNILFIAFSGEEAGLLGSKYFTEKPLLKLDRIKFLLNLDIMGSGEEGITVVNATIHPTEFEHLKAINSELNLLTLVKSRGKAANSDHHWFSEKGVPAFFIYTMGDNKHYHDIFDTYEELSFSKYENIVRLLVEFVNRI